MKEIKKCKKCMEEITDNAKICSKCNTKIKYPWYLKLAIGIIIFSIVTIILIISIVSSDNKSKNISVKIIPSPTSESLHSLTSSQEGEFSYLAQDTIIKFLKSPSTAKFPGMIMESNKWKVIRNKELVQVSSYVDSQNSFGAMIRSNFVVQVGYTDKKIIGVKINDKIVIGEFKKE